MFLLEKLFFHQFGYQKVTNPGQKQFPKKKQKNKNRSPPTCRSSEFNSKLDKFFCWRHQDIPMIIAAFFCIPKESKFCPQPTYLIQLFLFKKDAPDLFQLGSVLEETSDIAALNFSVTTVLLLSIRFFSCNRGFCFWGSHLF